MELSTKMLVKILAMVIILFVVSFLFYLWWTGGFKPVLDALTAVLEPFYLLF